jgi:ABC-type lipoprotein release transport system permease subunit
MPHRSSLAVIVFLVVMCGGPAVRGQVPSATPAAPPILLSRQLMARADIAVGDIVTLATDAAGTASRQFRVVGVYEPTPDPMRFTAQRLEARLHLPDLIEMTADPENVGSGETVNTINVRLADRRDAERFSADVAARMPGLEVRSTSRPPEGDPFTVLDRFHLAISLVTVAGSTAFLLALMVIRADERRESVGALRLLGISRRSLLIEVAVEGLLIATAGALFGAFVAFAAEGLINRVFQARYDTTLVFVRVTKSIALRSIALALPLGVLAGVGASWALLKRDVLSLVRR